MSKLLTKLFLALLAATGTFWLTRFGAWLGSLTTVRTELYFTLNHGLAWVAAFLAFVCVLVVDMEDPR